MAWFSYVWRVVVGLIQIFVVLALIHATQTKFETMAMAGMVVIYASIVGTFQTLGRGMIHISHKQLEHYISIGTLLKHENLHWQSEALKEEAEEMGKAKGTWFISSTINWLIGLIGTVTLLVTALT